MKRIAGFLAIIFCAAGLCLPPAVAADSDPRWSAETAQDWYRKQPWIVGCNFLPSTAVNDVEMWQAETFDPETIDRELGMAEELGFHSVRVFLNYVVWKADPDGFKKRFEQFLRLADKHGIRAMPIFFDDCAFAGREPAVGRQADPVPGVHNSGWVASPGKSRVMDRNTWPDLEKYVKDFVGTFRKDRRIVIWDLYNEPANDGMGENSRPLLEAVFKWTREMKPAQPLTVGAWANFNDPIQRRMMELSDIVSFHGYDTPAGIEAKIKVCSEYGRPVICTEWLLRQGGNKVETLMPMFRERNIGCFNWGLVAGRTQTYMHWGSPQGSPEPAVWQHDIFRRDGTPYNAAEVAIIQQMTGRLKISSAPSDFKGWNSQRLSNGLVELQIVPQIGGRIMQYAMGGKNFMWVNAELAGKAPPEGGLGPNGEWLNYGGDKLWPAPQGWDNDAQWPGPPDVVLDGGPYEMKVLSSGRDKVSVKLTSGEDKRSGIQFSRVITVHRDSTRVSFEATMKNVDSKPRRWGIWAHTQLNGGKADGSGFNPNMAAYCPMNPKSRFAGGYSVIFGDEANPSFQSDQQNKMMRVQYLYKVGKAGLDSPAGWVATVDGESGRVFVQRFVFEEGKEYPEGSSVEFWLNGLGSFRAWGKDNVMPDDPAKNPYVFESELISPFAALHPGKTYTWKYDWYLTSIGNGGQAVVDCNDAGVVSERLSAKAEGDQLVLTGRFGVFAGGKLQVQFAGADGKVIASEPVPGVLSPLLPVILDHRTRKPAGASEVRVMFCDDRGAVAGELTRTGI